jgi:O-antigen/teichoic acid export membrane protein
MIFKVIGTIFSRTFTSITGFILVILTANILGAEARGEIALVVLGVSISGLFQSIVGASAITYLLPKNNLKQMIGIAVVWSVCIAILINALMEVMQITPIGRFLYLTAMAIPQGLIFIAQSVLIAKKKIVWYNRIEYLRSGFLLTCVFVFFAFGILSVEYIFIAYIISNAVTAIVGLYFITKINHNVQQSKSWWVMFKALFKYGFEIQLNNIAQMFNYRFVYFLVEKWRGLEVLGVFSVAVAIAETIWIIAKSIATYQTAQLVNLSDKLRQAKLTLSYAKISAVATLIAVTLVVFLPASLFQWVFGDEFDMITELLPFLAPGILFLSIFAILNHYFYAINANWINIRAAFLGNVIALISGIICIYYFKEKGAALVYSFTFLGMLLFLLLAFMKNSGLSWSSLKISKSDFRLLK